MRNTRINQRSYSRQRGVVLAVSLVILLILTMVGLFISRSSSLELRMAGNAGAKGVSFENAEDARFDAEFLLTSIGDAISADTTGTAYDCNTLGAGYYAQAGLGANCSSLDVSTLAWDGTDSAVNPGNPEARFVIEYMGVDKIREPNNDVSIGSQTFTLIDVHIFRVFGNGIETSGALSTISTIFLVKQS